MFCHKCGTKVPDDAGFCPKCGTKLIGDTPMGQSASAPSNSPVQPPNQVPMNPPARKKSKLPIILGTAGTLLLVLVVLAAIGSQSDPDTSANTPPSSTQSDTSTPSSAVSNTDGTVNSMPTIVDDDEFVDNDALLGDDSGYEIRDSELYGRWRSYDGGYVEFSEYGTAALNFSPQGNLFRPDYITWESNNGQIIFISHLSEEKTWELSTSGQKKVLTLSNALQKTRYVSSDADDSLAGTWDRLSDPHDSYQYTSSGALVLSSDGTGTMDKLTSSNTWTLEAVPISWWLDGTTFHTEWTLQSACDYTLYGNTLTLFFSDGSEVYTKVGS